MAALCAANSPVIRIIFRIILRQWRKFLLGMILIPCTFLHKTMLFMNWFVRIETNINISINLSPAFNHLLRNRYAATKSFPLPILSPARKAILCTTFCFLPMQYSTAFRAMQFMKVWVVFFRKWLHFQMRGSFLRSIINHLISRIP